MKVSEQKRIQILQAARDEFQEQGFNSTSMDRIAQRAQVSKRTVYNHFANKERLFLACLEQLIDGIYNDPQHHYDPQSDIRTQLLAIANDEIQLMQSREMQHLGRILIGELVHNPAMNELLQHMEPSCLQLLQAWLRAACEDKKLAIADIDFAIEQFIGLLKASAFWPALLQGKQLSRAERERLAQTTVDIIINTYAYKGAT